MASFGALLRRLRGAAGLTQEQLAERAGISARAVSDLERGVHHTPQSETAARLATALGLAAGEREPFLDAARASVEDGPRSSPAPPPPLPPHPRLPQPLTPLVGREQELATVLDLLAQPVVRLVTLTGPGGVGKTRLALAVAVAAAGPREGVAESVVYVPLATISSPGLVIPTIARALGLRANGARALAERLLAVLHERRLLLVLDNLDYVVAAGPTIADLLMLCPPLTVLVTSRAALNLRGEQQVALAPLGLPGRSTRLDPVALLEYPAVRLFVERARDSRLAFALTAENAPAVAEVCRRLDGLPLALELAAARLRVLTPQALLPRLERRFELLDEAPRDLPSHQRTLRQTVAWSYDLLTPEEQRLWRRLGVFAGGCTLDSAAALGVATGDPQPDVLGAFASLVAKSLLHQTEGADGEPRFWMLETLLAFALEQLEAQGEAQAAARAHAEHFLGFAGEYDLEHGPRAPRWIDTVEQELVNFRAALDWLERQRRYGDALRLAARLAPVWSNRGYVSEGSATLRRLLDRPETAPPTRGRAFCLWYAGIFARYSGDLPRAQAAVEEMLTVARAVGDPLNMAYATIDLGWVAHERGDFPAAGAHYEAALAAFRAQGYDVGVSLALDQLAKGAAATGDQETARRLQSESLAIRRRIGHRWGVGSSLVHLGDLALERNDFQAAIDHYGECLQAVRPMGTPVHLTAALEGVAAVAASLRHSQQALRLLGAATALRETSGAGADREAQLRHRLIQLRAAGPLPPEERLRAETEGRRLTLEEAIADALTLPPPGGGYQRPSGG